MIDWDPVPGDFDPVLLALIVAVFLVVVCFFVGVWTVGGWVWALT